MGHASDPALVFHVKVALGMVVSLGVARVLTGMARFVQHPSRHKPDALLKGREHFQSLGVEYPVRLLALSTLAIAAAIVRNERFQIGFAAASLVYQLSWILRSYDKIG